MLSTYKYINHKLEFVQNFVHYIFGEIWMKSHVNVPYSFNLFKRKQYHQLISNLYVSDSETSDKFCVLVENIYNIISQYNDIQKKDVKKFYQINTNISRLCTDKRIQPISYNDLTHFDQNLSNNIKKFYDLLYGSGSILGLKEILRISNFKDHYRSFIEENNNICLCCGIQKLEIVKEYRSDYDHFLPKSIYPFVSINLMNLVPTCENCNRRYKSVKDPLYDESHSRRKVLYPYKEIDYNLSVNIRINDFFQYGSIEPANIEISFNSDHLSAEEINTWCSLYSIIDRYQSLCSFDDDGLRWIEDARNAMKRDNSTFSDYVNLQKAIYQDSKLKFPFFENRFIKIAFLEACQQTCIL